MFVVKVRSTLDLKMEYADESTSNFGQRQTGLHTSHFMILSLPWDWTKVSSTQPLVHRATPWDWSRLLSGVLSDELIGQAFGPSVLTILIGADEKFVVLSSRSLAEIQLEL